ncbi:uncharacterized protein LOC129919627 [Episyrphus balteatus]|uniref:uncharacterized protein LOC129919627 n=1 Tax=Episyrphus balteatus TaxID=286459 RepID=UPI0024851CE7|nr:uncharacterized protein LOC129919627 [Episyrphus balteatus]
MKNQSLFDIFKSREDSLEEEELPTTVSEVAKVTSIQVEAFELSISSQNNINNNLHETPHQTITFQEDTNNNLQEIQEETLKVSSTDPQDLNEAAIKIQATFKGYRVRKEMSNTANKEKLPNTPEEQNLDVDHLQTV